MRTTEDKKMKEEADKRRTGLSNASRGGGRHKVGQRTTAGQEEDERMTGERTGRQDPDTEPGRTQSSGARPVWPALS